MKTAEEILDDMFYKPEIRDWYIPVLDAMIEFASQFTPDRERVIEAVIAVYPTWNFIPSEYPLRKLAEMIADELSLPREDDIAKTGTDTGKLIDMPDLIEPSKEEQANDCIIKGGWECPRCGQMNAIWKSVCDCPPRIITSTTI